MESDVPPRFLVLTLFSDENELEECRRSLDIQRVGQTDHRIFSHLPKAEAHARLYQTIMDDAGDFDLFLKLDADMVLADDRVLERMAGYFDRDRELDHLVMGVEDWFTDSTIIGVHTYSSRVRWPPNPSGLFTDPDPVFPGRKLVVKRPEPPVVFHGPDPSPFQAFFFGVHRAIKACQRGYDWSDRQLFGARTNWQVLIRLWQHALRNPDRRLALALVGADLVLRGQLPPTAVNRQDPDLMRAFEETEGRSRADLEARLEGRWSSWTARQITWCRGMGATMTMAIAGRSLRDRLTAPIRNIRRARNRTRYHRESSS